MTPDEVISGFDPIVGPDPRVLILGTIPSVRSLAENRYYGHPRNCFWTLMERLFAAGAHLEYPERVEALRRAHVAVWDVLHAAERPGSLDADIVASSEIPNDIPGFLREHPGVHTVFFNGRTAEALFRRHIAPGLGPSSGIDLVVLPSTSPAHAARSWDEKLAAWSVVARAAAEERAR